MLPWCLIPPTTFIAKCITDRLKAKKYRLTNIRKLVQSICFLVQNVALLMVMNSKDFTTALSCMCLCIGIAGFHNAGVTVNPQDLSPDFSGSVFGLMNTFGSTFGFLGVYLAGHILELTQSWNAVFNICQYNWTARILSFRIGRCCNVVWESFVIIKENIFLIFSWDSSYVHEFIEDKNH